MLSKQINKLALVLGLGGMNGTVAMAALTGLFKYENAFSIAVLLMAGPGAILTAVLMDGTVRERMFAALIAGVIATLIVILAAGIGPKVLDFVNLDVLKIFGGIAILAIGLLIMGVKIPDKVPTMIMVVGLIAGILLR
jgi:small neutral amino acid transporter SnatA (MarC family)